MRSVEFPVLEPSGKRGMVLTWRLPGDGTGALTMCDFDENCTPGIILETEYTAMELTDLTGNGAKRSAADYERHLRQARGTPVSV